MIYPQSECIEKKVTVRAMLKKNDGEHDFDVIFE